MTDEPGILRPIDAGAEVAAQSDVTWEAVAKDAVLGAMPKAVGPSMRPAGADLDLGMGWDRFEQLTLALLKRVMGAREVAFRRYGTQGQIQHGIDLAGRGPDGSYVVVQCKEYIKLTAAHLRAAVVSFADGPRPFDARTFIVVTSASTQSTQLADELAVLQGTYSELSIHLWGSEILNDQLRNYADIVSRFWTHETAMAFCAGAAVPGVPAPPPDRQEQAERILLGPLNTKDVGPTLRAADAARATHPHQAAELFGNVALELEAAGFHGHSLVLRRRQLDVMAEAAMADDAIALASELAIGALLQADPDEARSLDRLITKLDTAADPAVGNFAMRRRHRSLIDAAVSDTFRTIGEPSELTAALVAAPGIDDPPYHCALVLYLAEELFACAPARLPEIHGLIAAAIVQADQDDAHSDVQLRLRLVRAEYDHAERLTLLNLARRHLVNGRSAALISAREARRCALEGREDEASEAWRDAVHDGIHAGLNDDAADWLYAIRQVNLRYGPWSTALDDEHRLAQALRATGSSRLLDRSREPREAAMSALVHGKPIDALLAARRWLIDTCVSGSWASEDEAARVLADIYAGNQEPVRAATLYQRAGARKKLVELARQCGDLVLPIGSWQGQPWWVLNAQAAQVSVQADLLDTQTTVSLLDELLPLARRGRAGELPDSPTWEWSHQVAKTVCDLAPLGSLTQAEDVLDLLADDVAREKNHFRQTDDEHASACVGIAIAHPVLASRALSRLLDLAGYDAQPAQKALTGSKALAMLSGRDSDGVLPAGWTDTLTPAERESLRDQVILLAEQGIYLADIVLESTVPDHTLVQERSRAARASILDRPAPDPGIMTFGTDLVRQAYLASLLPATEARACLDKLMEVASDQREAASNRQDALKGARNLTLSQPSDIRAAIFEQAQPFAAGTRDGSALDDLTGTPHPLSAAQINLGSASLRGDGLSLARAAAEHLHQYEWLRDQAVGLLRSEAQRDVTAAAIVLNQLPAEIVGRIDAGLLAASDHVVIRQVAGLLAIRDPQRHSRVLADLATDPDHRVRRALAQGIARFDGETDEALASVRSTLEHDPRHSVRIVFGSHLPDGAATSTDDAATQ